MKVGRWSYGVAVTPDGTKVYVANRDVEVWDYFHHKPHKPGTVSVIDTATDTVTTKMNVKGGPTGVAIISIVIDGIDKNTKIRENIQKHF